MPEKTMETIHLPLLVTRSLVLFPTSTEEIEASRPVSIAAIESAVNDYNSLIYVVAQKNEGDDEVAVDGLYRHATLARILEYVPGTGSARVRVVGTKRAYLEEVGQEGGCFFADGSILPAGVEKASDQALLRELAEAILKSRRFSHYFPSSALANANERSSVLEIVDALASTLPLGVETKVEVLALPTVEDRVRAILSFFDEERTEGEIERKIDEKVRDSAEKSQKEYILREKMKAIRSELGEDPDSEQSVDAIRRKARGEPLPRIGQGARQARAQPLFHDAREPA